MCGISSVIHPNELAALSAVRRMNDAQAHRGPDGVGLRAIRLPTGSLVFGHRRLAIQDLSPAGAQPMANPATGDVIVYNGELYNGVELRAELQAGGAEFRGHGDTEVLLAAFARWGISCLDRFCGMFAFALYAPKEECIYLARDPLGIKPLYWSAPARGSLVVASEVRAMIASGLVETDVDAHGLESLLAYGSVAGPRTMLSGVRLLEPGTFARIDTSETMSPSRVRPKRYWEFSATPQVTGDVARVAHALAPALRESVRSHLVSDVPVAVFLSGGIDSTVIAALASEARSGDIDTFTVKLRDDVAMDESPIARRTSGVIGARHHEVSIGESDARSLVTQWLASLDQPSVDGLNTFVISRAARERGIVVALSGLGGDEMFGGYSTFRHIPATLRGLELGRRIPSGLMLRLAQSLFRGSETRAEKLHDLFATPPSAGSLCLGRRRLMSNAELAMLGVNEAHQPFLPPECDLAYGVPRHSLWGTVRAFESRFYMGNMLLRDSDVFGMAHGLEIRVPLLDRRVVEVALEYARPAWTAHRSPNKPWLLAAAGDLVPHEVVRRKKSGFSLPQARWMVGPLRDEFEARIDRVGASGLVDERGVREVWARFLREPGGSTWSRAWLLGALGEWLAHLHVDRTAISDPEKVSLS